MAVVAANRERPPLFSPGLEGDGDGEYLDQARPGGPIRVLTTLGTPPAGPAHTLKLTSLCLLQPPLPPLLPLFSRAETNVGISPRVVLESKTPQLKEIEPSKPEFPQDEKVRIVFEGIKEIEQRHDYGAPKGGVVKYARERGVPERSIPAIIEHELQLGHLYEPKPGYIRRTMK